MGEHSHLRVGVLTVSDRASRGEYEDRGGPAIRDHVERAFSSPVTFVARIVPDERELIEVALRELADVEDCSLVLTTGGTGPAARDVTPDATHAVCERELPGFGEAMRTASRLVTPTAILSRQLAGTRGETLIVNLPGRPSAVADCLDAVIQAVPDCLALLGGPEVVLSGEPQPSSRHDG